jgi:hypothetical protein
MDERSAILTERIAFAESWLDRARCQIRDGQVVRGALTMLLAEAELQCARDSRLARAVAAHRSPGRPWTTWTAIAALALAAATALAISLANVDSGVAGEGLASTTPIVTLSAGSGEMLRLVVVPESVVEPTVVERMVVTSRIVRVPVLVPAAASPEPPREMTGPPSATVPAQVPPAMVTPVQAPAAPQVVAAAPAAPVLLTEAEVIDMVLAAERSLRRKGNQ